MGGVYGYYVSIDNPDALLRFITKNPSDGNYIIKRSGQVVEELNNKDEAIKRANEIQRSIVIDKNSNQWIYSTLSPFLIITDTAIHDFKVFESAIRYAKRNGYTKIYYNNDKNPIWEDKIHLPEKIKINVPQLMQLPELPRGCEVTSLAMIFEYYGKKTDKMELAQNIKKDTTPYQVDEKGRIHYGNPYEGFVGDMYNVDNAGYGVYHKPIAELASRYFKDKVIDLTGLEFQDILYFLSKGYPIWVVTNSTYKPLEESYFEIWHTPTGIVKITNKQHSVVITGYDSNHIYINDPLYTSPNRQVDKELFQTAWEQMGYQAITILK